MDKTYLTQKEFDEMFEYSMSVPTGVYLNKKWKRNNLVWVKGDKEEWVQGKYVKSKNNPDMCQIEWKEIVLTANTKEERIIERFKQRKLQGD